MEPTVSTRSVFNQSLTSFAGRSLVAPVEDDWASVSDVSRELGLTRSLAMQLMISEVARNFLTTTDGSSSKAVSRSGSKLFIPRALLEALKRVPQAESERVPYINVRLGPGTLNDRPGTRKFLGYHYQFSDRETYDGATYWWYFRQIDDWEGHAFVASIAGFVTLSGRIIRIIHHPARDRVRFTVDTEDSEVTGIFHSRRIPVHPGGPALKIGKPI